MMDVKTPSPCETNLRHTPSPIFKTPAKYTTLGQNSPRNRYNTTPRGRCLTTPKRRLNAGPLYNPFENATLDCLHLPTFSPNVFAKGTSTPSHVDMTPRKFRWSIDQQALLQPADIDEMPQQSDETHDENTEMMAQQAIDTFFSSNIFIPSPWTESSASRISPAEKSNSNCSIKMSVTNNALSDAAGERPLSSGKKNKKDASTQTVLTLPSDLDLQVILGEFFTYLQDELGSEVLSTSSLRRKLFFHGERNTDCSTSSRSTSSIRTMSSDLSPSVSPLKCATPMKDSLIATPASAQFSSSPITGHRTMSPSARRHGSFIVADHVSSPELSPIQTPVARPRCPLTASAVRRLDVECHGSAQKFSPSCGRPSISPDISPIKLDTLLSSSDSNHSPAHFNNENDELVEKTKMRIEFGAVTTYSPQNFTNDDQDTSEPVDMDISSAQEAVPLRYLEGQPWPWGLSTIRETSINESEMTSNFCCSKTNLTNQDTGYQTGSLQLTTDLTNQMGSLPISSRDCTAAEDVEIDSENLRQQNIENNQENINPFSEFKSSNVFRMFANHGQQTSLQVLPSYAGQSKHFHLNNCQHPAMSVLNPSSIVNTSQGPLLGWNPVGSSTPEKLQRLQSSDFNVG